MDWWKTNRQTLSISLFFWPRLFSGCFDNFTTLKCLLDDKFRPRMQSVRFRIKQFRESLLMLPAVKNMLSFSNTETWRMHYSRMYGMCGNKVYNYCYSAIASSFIADAWYLENVVGDTLSDRGKKSGAHYQITEIVHVHLLSMCS